MSELSTRHDWLLYVAIGLLLLSMVLEVVASCMDANQSAERDRCAQLADGVESYQRCLEMEANDE